MGLSLCYSYWFVPWLGVAYNTKKKPGVQNEGRLQDHFKDKTRTEKLHVCAAAGGDGTIYGPNFFDNPVVN